MSHYKVWVVVRYIGDRPEPWSAYDNQEGAAKFVKEAREMNTSANIDFEIFQLMLHEGEYPNKGLSYYKNRADLLQAEIRDMEIEGR